MKIQDLHNHTNYSYDSDTLIEDLINNAISKKIDVLGICDHQFSIGEKLPQYIEEINYFKEKYKEKIDIKCGLEIGLRPKPHDLHKIKGLNLDYCIFESLDSQRNDTMDLYEFLEWTRLFDCKKGLAHTDIFKLSKMYDTDILKLMREYDLFWEINTSGNYIYYYDFITNRKKQQEISKSGINVSIGSDNHNLRQFNVEKLKSCHTLVEKLSNTIIFL